MRRLAIETPYDFIAERYQQMEIDALNELIDIEEFDRRFQKTNTLEYSLKTLEAAVINWCQRGAR